MAEPFMCETDAKGKRTRATNQAVVFDELEVKHVECEKVLERFYFQSYAGYLADFTKRGKNSPHEISGQGFSLSETQMKIMTKQLFFSEFRIT